ncbi:hypothetical protein LIA77_05236 [Sarocladium implicatum]|nr:hypothetical protein LIA77_05236 [Sarocladium implicatum]
MPSDIDKSLLDRLQALRGASEPPESSPKISIDTIERAKTPTKEDALAARLKSLRSQDSSPHTTTPTRSSRAPAPALVNRQPSFQAPTEKTRDEDVDDAFQTDDKTLEDLLSDVGEGENSFAVGVAEPDDAKVKALLEELADSIPQDEEEEGKKRRTRGADEDEEEDDDDDSDGEKMGKEVDDVMARYRDEVEMDRALGHDDEEKKEEEDESHGGLRQSVEDDPGATLDLPSVPPDSTSSLPSVPSDINSLTTRLAALRTPSSPSSADPSTLLPSVPTSKPSKQPNRLTSRTNYTDEDADSWCTVCLEDATLRCIGCDEDVYCTRCWREMHVGERAGFDERGHRAVQFTRDGKGEKKRVAVGAS